MSPRWPNRLIDKGLIAQAAIGLVMISIAVLNPKPVLAQFAPPYSPQGYPPSSFGSDPYANPVARSGWFPGGIPVVGNGGMSIADRLWVRAEYLQWWNEGMDIPALVTTSPAGTPQNQAGILNQPDVSVLFGAGEINDSSVAGVRLRSGFWLTNQGTFAIESEYFQILEDQNDGFRASGTNGSPILARPFFDIGRGLDTAQLVSFENVVSGDVAVASDTDLRSFLINGRVALCPIGICNANGQGDRVDWIIGYRYIDLDDRVGIAENLNSEVLNAPGSIALVDDFQTSNEFNGIQLGIVHEANFRRARLESLLRVAVGNNTQRVNIAGRTSITENGVTDTFNGGLLAQRTNIGNFERDQFTMVPEIGFTLGFRVFDWLDATVGYTVLYLPNVVRAGDQISLDARGDLLAPEDPPVTEPLRSRFSFIEDDYWAQGLSFGAELRF